MELVKASLLASIARVEQAIEAGKSNIDNKADCFLPIGPGAKVNEIYWPQVYKALTQQLFGHVCQEDTFYSFRAKVLENIKSSRKTKDLAALIEQVYMKDNGFIGITPLSYLLLEGEEVTSGKTPVLIKQLQAMLVGYTPVSLEANDKGNNIIETVLIEQFEKLCSPISSSEPTQSKQPYLPFLAKLFTKDLLKLSSDANWFLRDFEEFVHLYSFLYLSQLALNLEDFTQRPSSKKLYFILGTEPASKDRATSVNRGYNSLFGSNGAAYKLFPYLSYLNHLTHQCKMSPPPFWLLLEKLENDSNEIEIGGLIHRLNTLLNQLYEAMVDIKETTCDEQIKLGIDVQMSLFDKRSKTSKRARANGEVFKVFKEKYASSFYKPRGGAGNFLQLPLNTVILLTNLVIGPDNKMLIGDLVNEFAARGIWLDIKSKQALMKTYEQIGNVEKLSDSGEAVYVKSTI